MTQDLQARALRFVCDGVGLEDWLWRLVAEDADERIGAAEALQAMRMGVPSVRADLETVKFPEDMEGHAAEMRSVYKAILARQGFDSPSFLSRLVALEMACQQQSRQRIERMLETMDLRDEQYERVAGQIVAKIRSVSTDADRERQLERLVQVSAKYVGSACADPDGSEAQTYAASWGTVQFAVYLLIEWTDHEFHGTPEALDLLWTQSKSRALGVLERMGSTASKQSKRLLRSIRRRTRNPKNSVSPFDQEARILASVCGGAPDIVEEKCEWLASESSDRRCTAAQFFAELGPATGDWEAEVLGRLEPMLGTIQESGFALPALASVGRADPKIRARVLERARDRGVRMTTDTPPWAGADHAYDDIMWERGVAIAALQYFSDHVDECLPVLLEAIDTFEEQDGDETYLGPHARVAQVLERFGPAAAAAAEPIARDIDSPDEDYPRAIVAALVAMGPAGTPALPHLKAFHRRMWANDEVEWRDEFPDGRALRDDDEIGWLIQRLGGEIVF